MYLILLLMGFAAGSGIIMLFQALLLPHINARYEMYLILWLQNIFLFILPALCVELWSRRRSGGCKVWQLSDEGQPHIDTGCPEWVSVMVLFIASFFASELLTWCGELLPVPQMFEAIEEEVGSLYDQLLGERDPMAMIAVWGATALLAPFSEELFFRGGMQGCLVSKSDRPHLAILLVAIVFSAIHMQWSGFFARLFLGLVLGYLAYYFGLWWAIFFHILNNALVLLSATIGADAWLESVRGSRWLIVLGLVGVGYVVWFFGIMVPKKVTHKENAISNED